MNAFSSIVGCLLVLGFLSGCGRKEQGVRVFQEVASLPLEPHAHGHADEPAKGAGMTAAAAPFMNQPAPVVPLGWKTPEGWTEKPGAGVRVASFEAEGIECAIIVFPAMMAGASVEAKVGIWLQQLGAVAPSQEQLVSFIAKPKKIVGAGGVAVELYDFADLLGPSAPASMMAGLFVVGENALSVRMKGSAKVLAGQKAKFVALCESLAKKE